MSDLQNQTPADTYKGLLQVGDYSNGVDANSEYVQDGEGTNSALSISTTKVGVLTVSPNAELDVNGNVIASGDITAEASNIKVTNGGSASGVGIYSPASNEMGISVDSSEAIRIDSDGKVGIGVTPSLQLHIKNQSTTNNKTQIGLSSQDGSQNAVIAHIDDAGNERLALGCGGFSVEQLVLDNAGNVEISGGVDISGNVKMGSTDSSAKLTAEIENNSLYSLVTPDLADSILCLRNAPTSEAANKHATLEFNVNGGTYNRIATISLIAESASAGTAALTFCTDNGTTRPEAMRIDSDGHVLPGADNTHRLGSASKRWDVIYVKDTNITTSDRQLKQDIEELSEAETRVAKACKGLLRKYRWKDTVADKGDEARIHFGIIAQDLEDAFTAEGLDASRYGVFVKNTWWEADRVISAVEAVDAVYDEEGNEVSSAIEAQPERIVTDIFSNSEDAPEGAIEVTQRGVRYSELLAFIIASI